MGQLTLLKKMVPFLGQVLGEDYEIVLHAVDQKNLKNSRIIAIANEQISKRTVDSPLTNLALQLIKDRDYDQEDYVLDYKAVTANQKVIKGSTFFIKNENNEIEGMLCINFDPAKYRELSENILKLAGIKQLLSGVTEENIPEEQGKEDSTEYLPRSIEDIVYSVVDPVYLNDKVTLSPSQKEKIISELQQQNVFLIKGSVAKVAKLLNISEPTVYRYLKDK